MTTATNYRRKTFATPLDALRWLTAAPLKRKVKNRHGSVVSVGHNYEGVVKFFSDGYSVVVDYNDCPLTAVEDEHGAIEEEKPMMPAEAALRAFYGGDKAPHLVDKIVALIREEIAAATVETKRLGQSPWQVDPYARLKPKGDA